MFDWDKELSKLVENPELSTAEKMCRLWDVMQRVQKNDVIETLYRPDYSWFRQRKPKPTVSYACLRLSWWYRHMRKIKHYFLNLWDALLSRE